MLCVVRLGMYVYIYFLLVVVVVGGGDFKYVYVVLKFMCPTGDLCLAYM